mgnify:CR=1 FL=1
MSVFENIQKAFDVPLMALGVAEGIPVYLDNVSETSTNGFIAGYLLDSDLAPAEMGVSESITGLYQIDVCYLSKVGSESINVMIDKVRAVFYSGSNFDWGDDCFDIRSVSVSKIMQYNGFAKKSITLSISGFTKQLG